MTDMETMELRDLFAALALAGLLSFDGQANSRDKVRQAFEYADMAMQERDQ